MTTNQLTERFIRINNVQERYGVSVDAIAQAVLYEGLQLWASLYQRVAYPPLIMFVGTPGNRRTCFFTNDECQSGEWFDTIIGNGRDPAVAKVRKTKDVYRLLDETGKVVLEGSHTEVNLALGEHFQEAVDNALKMRHTMRRRPSWQVKDEADNIIFEHDDYKLSGFYRIANNKDMQIFDFSIDRACLCHEIACEFELFTPDVCNEIQYNVLRLHYPVRFKFTDLFVAVADLHADGAPRAKDPDAVRDGKESGKSRKQLADDKRALVKQLAEEIRGEGHHFKFNTDFAEAIRQRAEDVKPPSDASVDLASPKAIGTILKTIRDEQIDTP